MTARLSRASSVIGIVSLIGIAVYLAIGCNGMSPFLAAQFASNSTITTIQGPGSVDPIDPNDGTGDTLGSVCELTSELRGLTITLENEAEQLVRFSITLVVSAGPGGFVCDDEVQNYLDAGYSDALIPGSGNTVTIGCDTIAILGGNRILTMEFGVNQGAGATLPLKADPEDATPTLALQRRDTGATFLPLPELIVFGNEDLDFICTGGAILGDLCSQRGFVYSSADDLPIGKSVESARIQGTICNEGFGTAPEWRLDKTLTNGLVQAFQYAVGGSIVITVLDRATDAVDNTRNQAVWLVTNSAGTTIHFPDR